MKHQIELKVPDIGDADAIELVKWNYNDGEAFSAGDELCDLVTDKAAFALEAPKNGTIKTILVKAGNKVKVGQVVGVATIND